MPVYRIVHTHFYKMVSQKVVGLWGITAKANRQTCHGCNFMQRGLLRDIQLINTPSIFHAMNETETHYYKCKASRGFIDSLFYMHIKLLLRSARNGRSRFKILAQSEYWQVDNCFLWGEFPRYTIRSVIFKVYVTTPPHVLLVIDTCMFSNIASALSRFIEQNKKCSYW